MPNPPEMTDVSHVAERIIMDWAKRVGPEAVMDCDSSIHEIKTAAHQRGRREGLEEVIETIREWFIPPWETEAVVTLSSVIESIRSRITEEGGK